MTNEFEKTLTFYAGEVAESLKKTDFSALAAITQVIYGAKENGRKIFTAGNGGSTATASHMCNDLLKGCAVDGVGYDTECLSDSSAVVTCLGNDFDYNSIFSIQLRSKARAGDILICFSGSGNSGNILSAIEEAKKIGMITVGFGGRDGGKMAKLVDHSLIAPTCSMEQIEDIHMMYVHAISDSIQKKNGTCACR